MKELKRFKETQEIELCKAYDILSAAGFEIQIEDGEMMVWCKGGDAIEMDYEEGIVIVPEEYEEEFDERQEELRYDDDDDEEEDEDETEQIQNALIAIEKANFPTIHFDEFGASEKHDGVYYSRGIGEVDGEEVDVTIYYDPTTEEVVFSIEELEEENK